MPSIAVASPVIADAKPTRPLLRLVPPSQELEGDSPIREVRVLIASGHSLLRAGYRALLESAAGISIAAEAATTDEAVSLASWAEADVVLLDSGVGGDAIDSIRALSSVPGTRVIVLTGSEHADHAFAMLRAGASGFLLMDSDPDELVGAVHAVAGGEAALSPSVTRHLIARFAAQPDLRDAVDGLEELTPREREVMALAARGLSNEEIGESLAVSRATAKTHINRAMMKLRARDRAQLVAFAYESGLVASRRSELAPAS
jgi:DNA-binding NarL/FixJ family response regulator